MSNDPEASAGGGVHIPGRHGRGKAGDKREARDVTREALKGESVSAIRDRLGSGRALFFDRDTGMIVVRHAEASTDGGNLVAARVAQDGFF